MSDYERKQHTRTLSAILLVTLLAALVLGILNLYHYAAWRTAVVLLVVAALCLPALWLNRRGYYLPAGIITSALVLAAANFNLIDGAGLRDPGVVVYPIIVIIGSLLFGKRAVPISTLLSIGSLVMVAYLHSRSPVQGRNPGCCLHTAQIRSNSLGIRRWTRS